mmetsp:Transcript_2742/g.7638  ORF Transcript_2742/g.7638 Transcript_2742/m.7638 type:complete len:208 (+) Transcript_2742:410-1033(+)
MADLSSSDKRRRHCPTTLFDWCCRSSFRSRSSGHGAAAACQRGEWICASSWSPSGCDGSETWRLLATRLGQISAPATVEEAAEEVATASAPGSLLLIARMSWRAHHAHSDAHSGADAAVGRWSGAAWSPWPGWQSTRPTMRTATRSCAVAAASWWTTQRMYGLLRRPPVSPPLLSSSSHSNTATPSSQCLAFFACLCAAIQQQSRHS